MLFLKQADGVESILYRNEFDRECKCVDVWYTVHFNLNMVGDCVGNDDRQYAYAYRTQTHFSQNRTNAVWIW